MSIVSPNSEVDMTEHSICQPGRPAPQGACQETSSAFADFQRAKSAGDSLSFVSSSVRPEAPASKSARFLFANLA